MTVPTFPEKNKSEKYYGDIVAGSLLIAESRIVAKLLLQNTDERGWHQAIVVDNLLQKRSPVAAKRQARLIKNRLALMKPALWRMVYEGTKDVAIQALLAAAIKHSRLLGDFMEKVVKENWRTFNSKVAPKDWSHFFESCEQADPHIIQWSESTKKKLKQVVFRILAEAGYLEGTRSGKLQTVSIVPGIQQYLVANQEKYVLGCMEATQ